MKKYLIIIMVISMTLLFGACGSEEDDSIVYGYANEALLKNMMYSYEQDGDYTGIELYQIGIYNDTYTLQGELD